jgi:hypothetical protein
MLLTMTPRSVSRLTRNAAAPQLLESFFIAAVASFLGIRWFLALTGYPRIGSNGIHIAHMLWGGLLMLLALMLLLGFLDRSIEHLARRHRPRCSGAFWRCFDEFFRVVWSSIGRSVDGGISSTRCPSWGVPVAPG